MLTWPHRETDWSRRLKIVEPCFAAIAREISLREKLLVVCFDTAHRVHVAQLLRLAAVDLSQVRFHIAPTNDTWSRDHGPITVLCRDAPLLLDFGFNGWGGKYPAALDDAVSRHLYDHEIFGQTEMHSVPLVLEGGSIEVDGQGTLLTTEQCLLAPTRNPTLSREDLERRLKDLLGLKRILWLKHGHLEGDDTDSHIDTLARFCSANTIAYVACDDPDDTHADDLKAMEHELKSFRAADGSPYRLVPLPWPKPKYSSDGERLPATYANFLIINGAVLVPTYDDPHDAEALELLQSCFPNREVIGINCLPLIEQFGSLHCVTMQFPHGVVT